MNSQSLSTVRVISGFFAVCLVVFTSNVSFAQQAPQTREKPKMETTQQSKQDSSKMTWDEYKADLKGKYQKVMDEVSGIEKQAAEKKINAPEYKEALNKFQEKAKDFGAKMKNSDAVAVEKQEAFKKDMKLELEHLNHAYDELKNKWATLNK